MKLLKERIHLAISHGGLSATAYWFLKILCRIQVHFLYAIDLSDRITSPITFSEGSNYDFISLHSQHDVEAQSPELISQLNEHSGRSVSHLLENGSTVYALVDHNELVSQLNISWKPQAAVETPTHLTFTLRPKDAFLGYLYTSPKYRGRGAARMLIGKVCEDIVRQKYSRIITHIRSTNVPSLNTFNRRTGWNRIGWILTSTNGRFLTARSSGKTGVLVAKSAQPTSEV